ncbi:MAG: carboxypeptidase regulatory-like domain-containing protein [Nitrospirae bacterium]|nr:carboxypeptidase regulatory-like domain-containing protein [Nitrospirota bacterium]
MKIAFRLNKRLVTAACIILFIAIIIASALLSPSHALTGQAVINIEKRIKSMEAAGNKAVAVMEKSIISIDPDSATFRVLAEFNKEVKAVSIDDTGSRLLVSLENEKDILILNLETGIVLKKIKAEEKPEAFCIDAVRNIAAVKLQGKGIIEIINLSNMTVAKKIKLKENISGLWCYSEKGLLLAAAGAVNKEDDNEDDDEESEKDHNSDKGRLNIFTENGEKIAGHAFDKGIRDVSIDSNNAEAAILTDDGHVYILDIETQVLTPLTALQYLPGDIELKGESLLVTDKESGNLITIDPATGEILKEDYIGKKAKHIAYTDSYCLVSFKDGIRVLEGEDPLEVSIQTPLDGEMTIAPSADVQGMVISPYPVVSVNVNGVEAAISGNAFTAVIPLAIGINTITVTATDEAGRVASRSINLTRAVKGSISGRVTDVLTGLPLLSANISITDSVNNIYTVSTAADGIYNISSIESGDFTGSITKDGYTVYDISGNVSWNQALTINAALSPILPKISNEAVTDITSSSAMVSWSTDLPADSVVEYGETVSYGNSLSDTEMALVHNMTLAGLKPATTYHIKITSTNNYGFSSSSDAGSFTTLDPPPAININITYPADGAALSRADTMASGTIVNATGNETGVTVNGVVAVVYNGQFFVNHLPLVEGENIITVNAVDTSGNSSVTSITVFADTTKPYVKLNSNIESGIATFDAYFSVDTSLPDSVSTYQMDGNYEGSFDLDYTGAVFDDVSFTYAYEGIYYPMILATDSAGNGYTDTIAVVVQDRVELDALLQGKWEGMKAALGNHNITTAVNAFTDDKQAHYTQLFNDIDAFLPQFVQDMQDIELIYAKNNIAKYRIRKNEVYAGQSYEIAYFIYFVLDENGIWKIDIF